jgi:bisphosphoglycerate-dependent phosphoglycerate mutase
MALPPVAFWFLRHGQTDYNAAGLSQGALDIALNETGRAQARAAAPLLVGLGIVEIVSSPMRRTTETTDIVNEALGLPVHFEPDLREVVFGGSAIQISPSAASTFCAAGRASSRSRCASNTAGIATCARKRAQCSRKNKAPSTIENVPRIYW